MYPGEYFRYFSFALCFFGACPLSPSLLAARARHLLHDVLAVWLRHMLLLPLPLMMMMIIVLALHAPLHPNALHHATHTLVARSIAATIAALRPASCGARPMCSRLAQHWRAPAHRPPTPQIGPPARHEAGKTISPSFWVCYVAKSARAPRYQGSSPIKLLCDA